LHLQRIKLLLLGKVSRSGIANIKEITLMTPTTQEVASRDQAADREPGAIGVAWGAGLAELAWASDRPALIE
jgi:hypothetical protein